MKNIILEMRGSPRRSRRQALDNVNLTVREAIFTLFAARMEPEVYLDEGAKRRVSLCSYEGRSSTRQERHFRNIADSEKMGIIIIHQELALVPLLSICENIFLGNEVAKFGIIDWETAERKTKALLEKVGLRESPETLIMNLGTGKQQLIEIAKALSKEVKLLILDEPTASLNENDREALLSSSSRF